MKKQTKSKAKKSNGHSSYLNWHSLNQTITTLERQAEKAYSQLKQRLPRRWERRLNELTSKDVIQLALKKRKQITKEVKYFADEIISTLSHADFLSDKSRLVKKAKRNLEEVLHKIQKSDVASRVKNMATTNGTKFFSLLNFPSKSDVTKLNARLSQLEKRLKNLPTTRQ